jgi:hypothetical protein
VIFCVNNEDTLKSEYPADVIKFGVHGKYANRYRQGTNLVLVDADLRNIFPDSASANCALRKYAEEHPILHR